jgi:hypothetical protein
MADGDPGAFIDKTTLKASGELNEGRPTIATG